MRVMAVLPWVLMTTACGLDPDSWASRKEIIEMARACGVPDFKPTRAGAAWAAYVPASVADHAAKEDCIYAEAKRRGRLVTR